MGQIKTLADSAFRFYVTDGVPGSGINEPTKPEIRNVFTEIDSQVATLAGAQFAGFIVFDTKASADGNLNYAANTGAIIYNDTDTNNGVYRKSGGVGAGAWNRVAAIDATTLKFLALEQIANRIRGARQTLSAVFKSGSPGQPTPISSTFNGWATAFNWDGTAFNAAKVWRRVDRTGQPNRVRIWDSTNNTLLAEGRVTTIDVDGFDLVVFDRFVSQIDQLGFEDSIITPRVLYISMDAGLTTGFQMMPYSSPDIATGVSTLTYPNKYAASTFNSDVFTSWQNVTGDGSGFPIPFELFDTSKMAREPSPDQLVTTPRLCLVQGIEGSVYFDPLRSGLAPRLYRAKSPSLPSSIQLNERWKITSFVNFAAVRLTIDCLDPNSLEVLSTAAYAVDCVDVTDAAGVSRKLCCIGDSTTQDGRFTQEMLDLSAAHASAVQLTLIGTQGSGLNKHEGRGGFRVADYYLAGAGNPFSSAGTSLFNASYYLTHNSLATPDVVGWHLGINDVFGAADDATAHATMDTYLTRLDAMIGLTTVAGVTPWHTVSAAIKHIVCVPIPPASSQDAFGIVYGIAQTYARYRRNIVIAAYRIVEHYKDQEANGVFLLPWNATVDPVNGFPYAAAAIANPYTTRLVERQNNAVHPDTSGVGGYQQMGAAFWAPVNVLVVRGLI